MYHIKIIKIQKKYYQYIEVPFFLDNDTLPDALIKLPQY